MNKKNNVTDGGVGAFMFLAFIGAAVNSFLRPTAFGMEF
jgi:hypothetical protein